MSSAIPDRGMLTDAILDYLELAPGLTSAGILIGDAVAPTGAGWQELEPGQGSFVGSVTLTTGVGLMGEAPDTIRSRHAAWKLVYGLRSAGGSRSQADFVADRARKAVLAFPPGQVDLGSTWVVQMMLFTRFGAMRAVTTTDVPSFLIDDSVEVWVTRSPR